MIKEDLTKVMERAEIPAMERYATAINNSPRSHNSRSYAISPSPSPLSLTLDPSKAIRPQPSLLGLPDSEGREGGGNCGKDWTEGAEAEGEGRRDVCGVAMGPSHPRHHGGQLNFPSSYPLHLNPPPPSLLPLLLFLNSPSSLLYQLVIAFTHTLIPIPCTACGGRESGPELLSHSLRIPWKCAVWLLRGIVCGFCCPSEASWGRGRERRRWRWGGRVGSSGLTS